jgi:hypothetical protein
VLDGGDVLGDVAGLERVEEARLLLLQHLNLRVLLMRGMLRLFLLLQSGCLIVLFFNCQ